MNTVQEMIRCKLGCVVSFYKAPTSYFTLLIIANGAHLLWFLFIVLLQNAQVRAIWSYDLYVENPVNETYQTCKVSLQIPMKVNHLECIKSKQLDPTTSRFTVSWNFCNINTTSPHMNLRLFVPQGRHSEERWFLCYAPWDFLRWQPISCCDGKFFPW